MKIKCKNLINLNNNDNNNNKQTNKIMISKK